MISVLLNIDGTDAAFELYVTLEEWTAWRDTAGAAGLSLPDWLISTAVAGAAQTLVSPPRGGALRQVSGQFSPVGAHSQIPKKPRDLRGYHSEQWSRYTVTRPYTARG
jgi:hypothetical protein